MQPFSFGSRGSRQRLLRRLDSAAERLNPFLIMIAIGLAILDAACLIALIDTGSLAIRRPDPGSPVAASAASTMGQLGPQTGP
jgi:hypothetical protein